MALLGLHRARPQFGVPASAGQHRLCGRLPAEAGTLNRARLLLLLCVVGLVFTLSAQVFREYDLKALFLYNFPQFVDWPAETFAYADAPVIVTIVGKERAIAKALDDLTRAEGPRRRKMVVNRLRDFAEPLNCHILFIDKSELGSVRQILDKCRGKSVLTVSDIDGFTADGGMIQFITDTKEKRIRLRVNVAAARAANLSISSKLLKLAEID